MDSNVTKTKLKLIKRLSKTNIKICCQKQHDTLPAQQHDHRVRLGRDESQQEDVATATVVTLQNRLPQRTILMQGHLLGLGSDQVVHNVADRKTKATIKNALYNNVVPTPLG